MFTSGVYNAEVERRGEVAKAKIKGKRKGKPTMSPPLSDHSFVVNIVMQHINTEVSRLEQNIASLTSGMKDVWKVGCIEDMVKSLIGPMFATFKVEVLKSVGRMVKEIKGAVINNLTPLQDHTGLGNILDVHEGGGDVNEQTIHNVMENLQQ